ncbi:hypothetical protein BGZ60DRAFT_432900 [Tricladium varicosporioides]|nr:hypothetical protein BGZ60DRAFT_432900 [Hymenoscyphus varicosporioides]
MSTSHSCSNSEKGYDINVLCSALEKPLDIWNMAIPHAPHTTISDDRSIGSEFDLSGRALVALKTEATEQLETSVALNWDVPIYQDTRSPKEQQKLNGISRGLEPNPPVHSNGFGTSNDNKTEQNFHDIKMPTIRQYRYVGKTDGDLGRSSEVWAKQFQAPLLEQTRNLQPRRCTEARGNIDQDQSNQNTGFLTVPDLEIHADRFISIAKLPQVSASVLGIPEDATSDLDTLQQYIADLQQKVKMFEDFQRQREPTSF